MFRLSTLVLLLVSLLLVGGQARHLPGQESQVLIPGLVGTQGNDLTLEYLYGVRTFQAPPNWPAFYFSADAGGFADAGLDTNACTQTEPCLTVEKAVDISRRFDAFADKAGRVIIYWDNDIWDAGADWGTYTGNLEFDNTGCGVAGTPGMADEPCLLWLPWDPMARPEVTDQSPPKAPIFDCSSIVMTSPLFGTSGSGRGYVGMAGMRVQNCPATPVDSQIIFQSQGESPMVLVNIWVEDVWGIETFAYNAEGGSGGNTFVMLNTGGQGKASSDFSGCTGTVDDPVQGCQPGAPGAEYQSNMHFFEFSTGFYSWITDRDVRLLTDVACHENCGGQNGRITCLLEEPQAFATELRVIGLRCVGSGSAVDGGTSTGHGLYVFVDSSTRGANTQNHKFARVTASGWVDDGDADTQFSGMRQTNDSTGTTLAGVNNFEFYQMTYNGLNPFLLNGAPWGEVGNEEVNALDTLSIVGRGILADELSLLGGTSGTIMSQGNCGALTNGIQIWDFDDTNVYDVDEGAGTSIFVWGADTYGTGAAVPTNPDVGCTDTISTNVAFLGDDANEIGGVGVEADAFGALDHASSCLRTECRGGEPVVPYLMDLPAYIPSAVVGRRINSLQLATHNTQVGAR